MNPDELRHALAALHAELSQTTEVDDATRQRLKEMIADIHRLAGPLDEQPPTSEPVEASSATTLQNMVAHFEARHPQLTSTLQQLIDRLAEIGI